MGQKIGWQLRQRCTLVQGAQQGQGGSGQGRDPALAIMAGDQGQFAMGGKFIRPQCAGLVCLPQAGDRPI